MKKNALIKLSYALGTSMVLVSSSFAVQMEGNYWSSSIGMASQPSISYHGTLDNSFLRTEPKLGGAFESAYGYQTEDLRVEGELLFLQNKIKKSLMHSPNFDITGTPDTGSTKVIGLMANGMYDFDSAADFTPYMGFGIGFVRITQDVKGFPSFTDTSTSITTTTVVNDLPVTTTSTGTVTSTTGTTTTTGPVSNTTETTTTGNVPVTITTYTQTTTKTTVITPNPNPAPGVTGFPSPSTTITTVSPTQNTPFPSPGSPTTVTNSAPPSAGGVSSATGSHLQFAYQTILGMSYKITDYFKLSLDYRYLKAMPTTFTVLDAGTPTPMRGSYSNHRLMLGVTAFLD